MVGLIYRHKASIKVRCLVFFLVLPRSFPLANGHYPTNFCIALPLLCNGKGRRVIVGLWVLYHMQIFMNIAYNKEVFEVVLKVGYRKE